MTKLQTSLVAEETWVDGAAEKLSALPTATSALELDVSTALAYILFILKISYHHISSLPIINEEKSAKFYIFFIYSHILCLKRNEKKLVIL